MIWHSTTPPTTNPDVLLNTQQIEQFITQGYVVQSGLVPRAIVEACRVKMWQALGMSPEDPSTWPAKRIITPYELIDLMKPCRTDAVTAVAEQLAGPHFIRGQGFAPVLNFPRPKEPSTPVRWYYHIDGLDEQTLWPKRRYLVLLMYLTDVEPDGGALAVSPGSHRTTFVHWARQGGQEPGANHLLHSDPLGEPALIAGKAGDVIFMHYLLAHCSSNNHSPRVREGLNGMVEPAPSHPYQRKPGPPTADWTPLDHTLRTDRWD